MASKSVSMSNIKDQTTHHESITIEKQASQWEELMRKFSDSRKKKCKAVPLDILRVPRPEKTFPTGSQYKGTWDVLGMSGYGAYTMPNGVIYEGELEDGMFDGVGEIRYKDWSNVKGKWKNGVLVDRTLVFDDGLEYSEKEWKYCTNPDRRFTAEYENGLQPAEDSYLTAEEPTRKIPPGYYDTGEGFYDPMTRIIYNVDDLSKIVRSPGIDEQRWIRANCRCSPEVSLGPRTDLYEKFTSAEVTLEEPPQPAAGSRATTTMLRSQSIYDQDLSNTGIFYNAKKWQSLLMSGRWKQHPFIRQITFIRFYLGRMSFFFL